ncbi:hypothetical protein [Staphylococcus aureus]|uniref:hypothetical protein n=1 Tax=Staphylococcus aureus TaxID=1280 RepID=UPI001D16F5C9|nr:hypothetical protein [Staphylococcus aureus]
MMKEERYHTLINHIDNHLDNSKIREVMTIDNNDEQFFKKKYQAQEREIILKKIEKMVIHYKNRYLNAFV